MTETASDILGNHHKVMKPLVTASKLDLCDKRRELKMKKTETEGSKQYKAVSEETQKIVRKAKEKLVEGQYQEIEENLQKNNSRKTYQQLIDLTPTNIQNESKVSQRRKGYSQLMDRILL